MKDEGNVRARKPDIAAPRRTYARPRLIVHGMLRDLTLGGSQEAPDLDGSQPTFDMYTLPGSKR